MATEETKNNDTALNVAQKRAEQRLPAGLGTLFAGLLLVGLAFVEGDSVWKTLHQVLFGLFGCGSFVLGAAVCCLAVLYTRGEDLLPHICKLALGLVFASGTVIVFSDIQPQGLSASRWMRPATRTVIRRGCPAAHWVRCWAATCCCSAAAGGKLHHAGAGALRQPVHF